MRLRWIWRKGSYTKKKPNKNKTLTKKVLKKPKWPNNETMPPPPPFPYKTNPKTTNKTPPPLNRIVTYQCFKWARNEKGRGMGQRSGWRKRRRRKRRWKRTRRTWGSRTKRRMRRRNKKQKRDKAGDEFEKTTTHLNNTYLAFIVSSPF